MPNLIRDARPADLDPTNDICSHYVRHSVAPFHERPLTADERLGFRRSGRLAEVGHKFGRWLDVVLMQKLL